MRSNGSFFGSRACGSSAVIAVAGHGEPALAAGLEQVTGFGETRGTSNCICTCRAILISATSPVLSRDTLVPRRRARVPSGAGFAALADGSCQLMERFALGCPSVCE